MSNPCIVIATDFSKQADHAISHAAMMAAERSAQVVLVHALSMPDSGYSAPYAFSIPEAYLDLAKDIQESSKAKLAEEKKRLECLGLTVTTACELEMPDRAILNAARKYQADLIIVGSHGRTGIARFLLGSVAEQVARHAVCDVLVARGPAPASGYRNLLVPTDLSDLSEKVLEQAKALLQEPGSISLLHCWELPGVPVNYFGSTDFGLSESIDKGAKEYGAKLVEKYQSDLVSINLSVERGDPRHCIEDLTKKTDFDLVVMGSHHRTGIQRLLLGSVAETTLRHIEQSVYITRATSE